jgi:hypothetical protein
VPKKPSASAGPKSQAADEDSEAQINTWQPAQMKTQLKHLAVERRTDMSTLIAEAINLLFVKYGKPVVQAPHLRKKRG